MEKTLKREWIDALCSGDYVQGEQGYGIPLLLRKAGQVDTWNVFGVLLDIVDPKPWKPIFSYSDWYPTMDDVPEEKLCLAKQLGDHVAIIYCYFYLGSSADIPVKLTGSLSVKEAQTSELLSMNYRNESFEKMSRWIDACL